MTLYPDGSDIEILLEVLLDSAKEAEVREEMEREHDLEEKIAEELRPKEAPLDFQEWKDEGYASAKDAEESGAEFDSENKGVETLNEQAEREAEEADMENKEAEKFDFHPRPEEVK